ncbi:MAG TPA: extracellular solute-binding protein, partial [Bacteroidota bacterium]|nr:extracellular solute-binding protein [Bacteroidota bacterium]
MKSFVKLLMCVLFSGLSLCGCARNTEHGTVITFWAMGADGEYVTRMLPAFAVRHPEISVKVQIFPWNAAHEKLLTAFAGGSLPDLFQLGNTWIPEFRVLNAIDDLRPYVENSASVRDTDYFAGIWDTNVIDSALCGIPWYVDTRVLFYRTDLVALAGYARAPRSWDEWIDLSAKMKGRFPADYANFFSTNNEWAP